MEQGEREAKRDWRKRKIKTRKSTFERRKRKIENRGEI
jgi:hypothetical protein